MNCTILAVSIAVTLTAVAVIAYRTISKPRYSTRAYMAGLTQAERDVRYQGLVTTLNNAWDSPMRDTDNFWIDQSWEQGYADYLLSDQAVQANAEWEATQCK